MIIPPSAVPDTLVCDSLERIGPLRRWRDFVMVDDPLAAQAIRAVTRTGRLYGGEAFVRKLEKKLGRRLARTKPGRTPKRTGQAPSTAYAEDLAQGN